jgi:hypothetical protein
MNLEDIAKDVQDGWVYQGRTTGNKFVLIGPFFLQPDVLCFQVRVERHVVSEGTARDATLAFSTQIRGEPTKLARVMLHKD